MGTLSPPAASRGEIDGVVETLSRELDEIAATLADTIHEHLLELEDDLRPWTLQAARANLGVIVTMMREGDDPGSAIPPAEAIGYAKEYVVRGLELSLMQRAYRTGQSVFAGIVLERLRAATDDADLLAEAMSFFNAWIFAWVEAIERRLTDVYMSEHAQWVRGASAVRAAEVRALLSGGTVDAAAASLRLGYELERFHVGFVIWSEAAGEGSGDAGELFAEMERAAATVAESLGAGAPLTVAEGGHLTCWAGSQSEPELVAPAPPPRRRARPLGRRRNAGGRGRGLRLEPPRGAPGAPRRPPARRSATAPSPPTRTWRWRRCSPTTPRPPAASPPASSARSPAATTRRSASPRPWRSSSRKAPASSTPAAASASTPTPSPTASAAPNPCSAAR